MNYRAEYEALKAQMLKKGSIEELEKKLHIMGIRVKEQQAVQEEIRIKIKANNTKLVQAETQDNSLVKEELKTQDLIRQIKENEEKIQQVNSDILKLQSKSE